MKKYLLLLLIFLGGCSLFSKNDELRSFQTKTLNLITKNAENFGKCAKNSNIFKNSSRMRVVMFLSINSSSKLESFRLNKTEYSQKLSECFLNIVDLLDFPKNNMGRTIEIEQPFIFSDKQ